MGPEHNAAQNGTRRLVIGIRLFWFFFFYKHINSYKVNTVKF